MNVNDVTIFLLDAQTYFASGETLQYGERVFQRKQQHDDHPVYPTQIDDGPEIPESHCPDAPCPIP